MTPLTALLIDRYDTMTRTRRELLTEAIIRRGGSADAEALLDAFLAAPDDRADLLDVIARHGRVDMAESILAAVLDGDRLRDDAPTEALWAVGRLGYEPAERLLWEHVDSRNGAMEDACLGLFHLSCATIRDDIDAALRRDEGSALFAEFLPLLAVKTGDDDWPRRLVDWGRSASTDCNGGLLAGIAAFGDRERFETVLWDPWWETFGGGTGTDRWAYAGCRLLGLGIPALYDAARSRLEETDGAGRRAVLATFAKVLWHTANGTTVGLTATDSPEESALDLHDAVFEWSTPHRDDSVIGLAGQSLDRDSGTWRVLYEARDRLSWRARVELLDAG